MFTQPFNDLLFEAQTVHRRHFNANRVQVSTLLALIGVSLVYALTRTRGKKPRHGTDIGMFKDVT